MGIVRCSRQDCIAPGKWQPGWRAWAKGFSKRTSVPIVSYMGLALCDGHKADTTIEDLVTPEGAAMVNAELEKMRKVPLDFSTAEVVFHEIKDGKLFMPGK